MQQNNTATPEDIRKVVTMVNVIVEAVKETGTNGAPEGPMYAALMAHGCTLDQFNLLVDLAVRAGKLRKRGHLLFAI